MEACSLKEITKAVCGRTKIENDIAVPSVCTDTRQIIKGSLFIALKGEKFDGHDFAEKAVGLGACAAVVNEGYKENGQFIYVKDTRKALLDLSAWYRRRFDIKVVGITGSVGKTTTKEMVYAVLSSEFNTMKTQGNLNNEIGLPKTLLDIESGHKAAVIEMGMSALGEIERLSNAAGPDIGIITNIGVSHIENLGSRENILKAKLEILSGMNDDAPLIVNADDDMLAAVDFGKRTVLSCGIKSQNADIHAASIEQDKNSTKFNILYAGEVFSATIPVLGEHNVTDALFGFAAGILAGIAPKNAAAALSGYRPAGMRQAIKDYDGVTVIADCYNASPDSMKAALTVLCGYKTTGKRIAVLGDMLELGAISEEAHCSVGRLAAEMGVDTLVCIGENAERMAAAAKAAGLKEIYYFGDKAEAAEHIRRTVKKGDAIIFKASRGVRLEEVIERAFNEDNKE